MDISFQGKVAFITGAGSGIGQATAIAFAGSQAKTVIVDVDTKGNAETLSKILESGGDAFAITADVSNAREVENAVQKAVERYGHLDCAFNNAGVNAPSVPIADIDESDWDRVITVNLKSIWLCMKYQIRQMLAQKQGAIVNTASSLAFNGYAGLGPYVASKHGVMGITRVAALEYAKLGIRVNAVCPGTILTPLTNEWIQGDPDREEFAAQSIPIGRLGRPDEIASMVLLLCSDKVNFAAGAPFIVDGGFCAA